MSRGFPTYRFRRLRRTESLREMVRETALASSDLIAPLFVKEDVPRPVPIPTMPGQVQHTPASMIEECGALAEAGVPAVMLFGVPSHKDEAGTAAWDPEGVVQQTMRRLRGELGDRLVLIPDLCLCEYTSHGHCGVLRDGDVDNDATLETYARIALSYADAGADFVAPSGMMDGQVGAIRGALDAAGRADVGILAYGAKYASVFFEPFRHAAESAPKFGNRRAYQMDPANADEAVREIQADIDEGADIVMVKPALPYLDVLRRVKTAFGMPTAAYHVSGEYAMLKAAAANGWLNETQAMFEVLTAIRRAGADLILTYFARAAAERLRRG
ncbi:MAG TPA: porphobilinogen synthase [bacterium]|nr:porphobilinogen synthase [bacterium]